jgi:thiol-disulfide isomerase/thioredoxin
MIFKTFDNSNNNIEIINKYIEHGKDVFILVFMEGCGPCNATRPEWNKIKDILEEKYINNNNIVVIDVNNNFLKDLKYIGEVDGFPTLKYISENGNKVENYEDASIDNKDRSVDSFIKWIESKIDKNKKGGSKYKSSVYNVFKRLSIKKQKKRKTRKTRKSNKRRKTRKTNKRRK